MAKYLLLTFVMNIITILVTVIIINVYFRGPTTHRMPNWVRKVFLEFLPKVLLMRRPVREFRQEFSGQGLNGRVPPGSGSGCGSARPAPAAHQGIAKFTQLDFRDSAFDYGTQYSNAADESAPISSYRAAIAAANHPAAMGGHGPGPMGSMGHPMQIIEMNQIHRHAPPSVHLHNSFPPPPPPDHNLQSQGRGAQGPTLDDEDFPDPPSDLSVIAHLSPEAQKAIEAIEYITEHLKQDDEYKKVKTNTKR